MNLGLYIHRHANKLKGQFSIPSALQQTICCSLNDSCLAQEQVQLPLCNTRVCCWHSSRNPQLRAALPTPAQPVPCPSTSLPGSGAVGHSGGNGQVSLKTTPEQETFPRFSFFSLLLVARTGGPGLKTCLC